MADNDIQAQARRELAKRELARRQAAKAAQIEAQNSRVAINQPQEPARQDYAPLPEGLGDPGMMFRRNIAGTPVIAASLADAAARRMANTFTGGLADKGAAALDLLTKSTLGRGGDSYGENLANERAKSKGADDALGPARFLADIPAGMAMGASMLNSGLTASRYFGPKVAAMIDGAGLGALSGFGYDDSGDAAEKLQSTAMGAGIGGATGGIAQGVVGQLAKMFQGGKPQPRAIDDVRKAAEDAYDFADNAGVIVSQDALRRTAGAMKDRMVEMGFDPILQPKAARVFDRLQEASEQGTATLKGVQTLRRVAQKGKLGAAPDDAEMISAATREIDDMLSNPQVDDIIAGDVRGLAALQKGNKLWAKSRRYDLVEEAMKKAENRVNSTGSGANIDNAIRQEMRKLLESKQGKSFTKDERAALQKVVDGTKTQNALRLAGKLAPTGVVSGVLSGGAGYGLFGPLGTAVPVLGAGAKAMADRATKKNVQSALDLIVAASGKKAATNAASNPSVMLALRSLMAAGIPGISNGMEFAR